MTATEATGPSERIIVAVDRPDAASFWAVADPLAQGAVGLKWIKIGSVLFCAEGPAFVREVVDRGFSVFLDLKLHDIPHQVGLTVVRLADLGVQLITVHTAGGPAMLDAAVAAAPTSVGVLGVTVLTSHDGISLPATGVGLGLDTAVELRAGLAAKHGLAGIVCSPLEVAIVRPVLAPGMEIVTPGIRSATASTDDHGRTATPIEALAAGATKLVIGRPITNAASPVAAFDAIAASIG